MRGVHSTLSLAHVPRRAFSLLVVVVSLPAAHAAASAGVPVAQVATPWEGAIEGGACSPKLPKVDCKMMKQPACEAAGCCWQPVQPNPNNQPWCSFSSAPSPSPPAPSPSPPAPAPHPAPPTPPPPPPGPPGPYQCELTGCNTYQDNHCAGDTIVTNASFARRRWFTPDKGQEGWQTTFGDYGRLVASASVVYSSPAMQAATLTVTATSSNPRATFTYQFDSSPPSAKPAAAFSAATTPGPRATQITVTSSDGAVLTLKPMLFAWQAPPLLNRTGDYRKGQKGAIVEMFGWPHLQIASECPSLAAAGYLGVKVYPPQESVMSTEPFNNMMNPWYFFYQPVSHSLDGRLGSFDDLRTMIAACRKVGVRVYADAVVNHMSGSGNDCGSHRNGQGSSCVKWGSKNSTAAVPGGKAGPSPYYTQGFGYACSPKTKFPASQEFPAVPFGPEDFHCERALNSWTDPLDLNAGWLTGLTDLNTERANVQDRIAEYLTYLISVGFSGFRVDAAKHMHPDDLVAIFSKLKVNLGGELPEDFITWWEILLGGESDLLMCNAKSGYNYGGYLVSELQKAGFSKQDQSKVKIWNSGYPKETEKGLVDCDANGDKIRSVIQNDDADQQNPGSSSRDMGNSGCVLIKGCAVEDHRAFEVKLFTSPNGATNNDNDFPIRMVLSSYWWQKQSQGIPDGLSDCKLCEKNCAGCQTTTFVQAFDDNSKGYDMLGYTRVHRDAAIVAAMREWMHIA